MYLYSGLLLPFETADPAYGAHFFRVLNRHAPELIPQKCGVTDPLKFEFDVSTPEDCLQKCWQFGFGWKGKKVDGSWFWSAEEHSALVIDAKIRKDAEVEAIKGCFREIAGDWPIDLGYIHPLTAAEPRTSMTNMGYSIFTVHVAKHIPYMPWGILLGPPYIEAFGEDKVLSSPCAKIEKWKNDLVYLQITDSIFDVEKNYDQFDERRNAVVQHLGEDFFFRPGRPSSSFKAPRFEFGARVPSR